MAKPTIHELEAILDENDPGEVVVKPDGSVAAQNRPITEQEKAVLEVAREWDAKYGVHIRLCPEEYDAEDVALANAVDALNRPQPVSPEQLQPGTPFQFEDCEERLIVATSTDRTRVWFNPENGWVGIFCNGDLVIPISEKGGEDLG